MNKSFWIIISAFALVVVGVRLYVGHSTSEPAVTVVDVKVPELSQVAALGARDFEANCVSCHGENASGTENGPPLVHDIYRPGHHPDYAFRTAAKAGVRAHHWRFGNMPPQPEVTAEEINRIIVYVRELQKENGIL